MTRCNDRRNLSELDPVTFFIVTELMAEREQQPEGDRVRTESSKPTERIEDFALQVA